MPNQSGRKGTRRENELVGLLDDAGYAVMRAPASGAATKRELPDLLAGDGTNFFAIEAKASGGRPIYIDADEIRDLTYFSAAFGAVPVVAVRFDVEHGDVEYGDDSEPGWYFFHPDSLYETPGGNLRVKKENRTNGVPLSGLVRGEVR